MSGVKNKFVLNVIGHFDYSLSRLRDKLWPQRGESFAIMFHGIVSDGDSLDDRYSVTEARFMTIVDTIVKRGYKFVSMDDYNSGKHNCILSFDDGLKNIKNIIGYIEEKKIPFIIYIITDRIGTDGYLTEDDIRMLSTNELCTIGSHTCSHCFTRNISGKELDRELVGSKNRLEQITGRKIEHFAFPFGSLIACSFLDKIRTRKAGYKTAVSTKQRHFGKHVFSFDIPRFDGSRNDILDVI